MASMTNVQLMNGSATIYGTYDGPGTKEAQLCFQMLLNKLERLKYFALSLELFGKW